jgi:hypothetical protein
MTMNAGDYPKNIFAEEKHEKLIGWPNYDRTV